MHKQESRLISKPMHRSSSRNPEENENVLGHSATSRKGNQMDLHLFCHDLGFDIQQEMKLLPCWDTLVRNTMDELPFFMKREFYETYYPMCGGPMDVLERMDQVAEITRKNRSCIRDANILHYGHFVATPGIDLGNLPPAEQCFGENAGIFQLMVALSSLPLIARTHAKLGLPEHFLADTATWIGGTIASYAAAHRGIPGHTPGQTYWLRLHIDGKLFRIGRLEYLIGSWLECLPAVYQQKETRDLTVLCRDQWTFDRKGIRFENMPETPAFTTHLYSRNGKVYGNAVHPDGTIEFDRETSLDLSEWEELCSAWDLIPSLHIPGGGGMTPDTLKKSMLEAKEFFLKYFHTEVKAFVCNSWIFNPAWEKELPHSNMAEFQRNVYRCIHQKANLKYGMFFVYGNDHCDPRTQPRTTALHKAFCAIFDRQEPLTTGSVFIRTCDLNRFGTGTYRK